MTKFSLKKYLLRRMDERSLHVSPEPKAIDAINLLIEDEQKTQALKPIPPCFGKSFAAPEDKTCRKCHVQVLCMHRSAHVRLLQEHYKTNTLSVSQLSKSTGWPEPIVRRLQNVCRLTGAIDAADVNRVVNPKTATGFPTKSWPKRFLRERRRLPELNHLRKGAKLLRHYHGEAHIVEVMDGSYLYKGQHYPTLYTVAMAIAGHKDYRHPTSAAYRRTMGNFSARKFFFKAIEQVLS